jgi:hypothetical protein
MLHRHINHGEFTLAAIDSIIERGSAEDWRELREAVPTRPELIPKIRKVCEAELNNPYSSELYEEWLAWLATLSGTADSDAGPFVAVVDAAIPTQNQDRE